MALRIRVFLLGVLLAAALFAVSVFVTQAAGNVWMLMKGTTAPVEGLTAVTTAQAVPSGITVLIEGMPGYSEAAAAPALRGFTSPVDGMPVEKTAPVQSSGGMQPIEGMPGYTAGAGY